MFMIKNIILIATMLVAPLCAVEVIELNQSISTDLISEHWYRIANRGFYVDSSYVYVANKDHVIRQKRVGFSTCEEITVKPHKKFEFTTHAIDVKNNMLYYSGFLVNEGQYHLYKQDLQTNIIEGPYRKPISLGRQLVLSDDKVLVCGNYRPGELRHHALMWKKSAAGLWGVVNKENDKFLNEVKPYSLILLNGSLHRIDSLALSDRPAKEMKRYDIMYLFPAIDVDTLETIYYVSNQNGLELEVFEKPYSTLKRYQLHHPDYVSIPSPLTDDIYERLKSVDKAYSSINTLYVKSDHIIVGFFQAPAWGGDVVPGCYYCILDADLSQVAYGALEYPIVAEDSDGQNVYLLVHREGGWFERDRYFLVGVTIAEILKGEAQKSRIEALITRFIAKHDE